MINIASLYKHRYWLLAAWIMIVGGFLAVIGHRLLSPVPVIDNSVGVWFLQDDPLRTFYEQYNRDFGEKEWSLLLLETDDIYSPVFLRDLQTLTEQLKKIPHIKKVTSLTNVRDNKLSPDGVLDYLPIYRVKYGELASQSQLTTFKQRLMANELFDKNLFRRDSRQYTVVLIQNDNLIYEQQPYRIELVDRIKQQVVLFDSIKRYALAGTTVVNAELNRAARDDAILFYILITVFLAIFALVSLRSIRDIVVLFSVVLGSMLPAMGLLALLDIAYNMVTIMMPTILISLSVAGVVHVISEFHMLRVKQRPLQAAQTTIQQLWKPALWTALTTIVAFSSLTLSTVNPVFQLGLFAAIGIFLAWLNTVFVAPVLLVMLWQNAEQKISSAKRGLSLRVIDMARRGRGISLLLFVLLLLPLYGLGNLETDTNYTKFFDSKMDVSQSYDAIARAGFAQNPLIISVEYPENSEFGSEQTFSGIVQFEQAINSLAGVIKIMSTTELVRQIDRAFNAEHTSEQKFLGYNRQQINQLLLLGELSGNDDIKDFLSQNKRKTQIVALTPYMSSKELAQFNKKVQALRAQFFPPSVKVRMTGTTVLWANMDENVSQTQLTSILGVGLFLIIFLITVFRSIKLGVITVIANFLPLAITLGTMGWFDIKINLATALIGGVSLGVVVDDTLHFIYRVQLNLKNKMDWDEAIDNAMLTVGQSIIKTTVIITGGFITLASSSFLPSSHFGIFISIAIVTALFFDLFVLPAVLKMLNPGKTPDLISSAERVDKN